MMGLRSHDSLIVFGLYLLFDIHKLVAGRYTIFPIDISP